MLNVGRIFICILDNLNIGDNKVNVTVITEYANEG